MSAGGHDRLPFTDQGANEALLTTGQVRTRLKQVVIQLGKLHAEVDYLIGQLRKRPPVRKAAPHSASVTPELRKQIETYAAQNPHVPLSYIASLYHVNPGRVSEILAGIRGKK